MSMYGTVRMDSVPEAAVTVDLQQGGLRPDPGDSSAWSAVRTTLAHAVAASRDPGLRADAAARVQEGVHRAREWNKHAPPERRAVAYLCITCCCWGVVFGFFPLGFLFWPAKPEPKMAAALPTTKSAASASTTAPSTAAAAAAISCTSSGSAAVGKAFSGTAATELRQLPCFSGACDLWAFGRDAPADDAACDRVSEQFGCQPCNRTTAAGPDALGARRWVVCTAPPKITRATGSNGVTFTAVAACDLALDLRVYQLPCWSGSCRNYLLEVDSHGFLSKDPVCNYWASALGCQPCKKASQVASDLRLQAMTTFLPAGRPASGRIAICNGTAPALGVRKSASGISYTVAENSYWTQASP